MEKRETKMVAVMRKDLNMTKGKFVAQGGHGYVANILKMANDGKTINEQMPEIIDGKYTLTLEVEVGSTLDQWLRGSYRKIAVCVNSEDELLDIYQKALDKQLSVTLIEDNGLTMFHGVKTKTCLVLGPYYDEDINEITGHLKLL